MVVVLVVIARAALRAVTAEAMFRANGWAANMGCIVTDADFALCAYRVRMMRKRYSGAEFIQVLVMCYAIVSLLMLRLSAAPAIVNAAGGLLFRGKSPACGALI